MLIDLKKSRSQFNWIYGMLKTKKPSGTKLEYGHLEKKNKWYPVERPTLGKKGENKWYRVKRLIPKIR